MDTTPVPLQLIEMVKYAKSQELLIRSHYQDILFFPDELLREFENGRFIWGIDNWTVELPSVELARLDAARMTAQMNYSKFKSKLSDNNITVR